MPVVLTHPQRTRARRLLLGAIVLSFGALVVAPVARRSWSTAPPPAALAGWTLRGVHRVRLDDARATFELSAGEVHVERSRFGMFRIGVAHTLLARDVRIDVHARGAGDPAAAPPRRPAANRATRPAHGAITTVRLDGLHLHLDGVGPEHLDIRAERCEVNLLHGERMVCHQAVHLRGVGIDHRFAVLEYDIARRRFTVPDAPPGDAAVAELNTAVFDLAPPDLAAVRANLAALL